MREIHYIGPTTGHLILRVLDWIPEWIKLISVVAITFFATRQELRNRAKWRGIVADQATSDDNRVAYKRRLRKQTIGTPITLGILGYIVFRLAQNVFF